MYLRIAWGRLRPGAWDEYERHYCERIVPSDQEFDGLLDRQLLQCAQNPDEGISFSVWDNLEDMAAYENSETHQAFAKEVEHLYRGDYWVKTIEFTQPLHANRGAVSEREPAQLTVPP